MTYDIMVVQLVDMRRLSVAGVSVSIRIIT